MFVAVDRLHELERMRRSIAMLQPGTKALSREDAMRLIAELQDLERRRRTSGYPCPQEKLTEGRSRCSDPSSLSVMALPSQTSFSPTKPW
jgi:hypothetical protein